MGAVKPSILVIDDESIVRESIAAYLEDSGYRVIQAADGEQGLASYHQQQPDVVLCDLRMPAIDGITVLKELTALPANTPIIVISGVGIMSDVVEALRFGASDYLIKPIVDMEVLEHAVQRCLEQGRLQRENLAYRQQLEKANLELMQSLKVLEQDQQAGRHVQMKMLPPTSRQFGDYHFSHRIIPSLYLSGDFVDYFTVGDDYVVFVIADVSGHGSSSAFMTVMLKNLFARKRSDYVHHDGHVILSPVDMLAWANRELLETETGKHLTMCMGVIDLQANQLVYSNAGHLPLPVIKSGSDCHYLEGAGMPVGLFEQAEFQENTLKLPETFILTLFSDGILEVLDAEGVLAQESQLLEKLQGAGADIDQLASVLELEDLCDIPDDIAILLVSRS